MAPREAPAAAPARQVMPNGRARAAPRAAPAPAPAPQVQRSRAPAPTTAVSRARAPPPNFRGAWFTPAPTRTRSGLIAYDTKLWGAPLWRALHTAAEVGDLTAWAAVPAAVATSLPCPDCEKHYAAWITSRPPPASSDRNAVRTWLLDLHNAVNRRTGKGVWTAEQVTATYTDIAAAVAALNSVASMVGAPAVAALRAALTVPEPVVVVEAVPEPVVEAVPEAVVEVVPEPVAEEVIPEPAVEETPSLVISDP